MLISNFDLDLSLDFIYKEHKIAKNNYFINVQPSAEIGILNNYPNLIIHFHQKIFKINV